MLADFKTQWPRAMGLWIGGARGGGSLEDARFGTRTRRRLVHHVSQHPGVEAGRLSLDYRRKHVGWQIEGESTFGAEDQGIGLILGKAALGEPRHGLFPAL